jgi:2,4-dienoyl-CoA reductase-like NADH-dependent reductase (Old Yellow Enzyme family)
VCGPFVTPHTKSASLVLNNNVLNMAPQDYNRGASGVEYFTPEHITSPGTPVADAKSSKPLPTLFKPLTIRGTTLRNRILVAPMCQYSTASHGPATGALTDYHIATLGHYALKGAGLVFIEATGVQANGRISPNCPGIWTDAQIPALRRVSDFIKSQGALSGLQLAHAGRKASTCAPWVAGAQKTQGGKRKVSVKAEADVGGWPDDVVGPMGGQEFAWDEKTLDDESGGYWAPRALSESEIEQLVQDWAKAAQRAVQAGINVIEIHAAHGYLIHQFLSPITNRRTDKYGGSFENRTRILIEVIQAIRKVIPETMPLYLRISSTEWMEDTDLGKRYGSWDVESSIELAKLLPDLGVDLLDVSSGGNHPGQRLNPFDSNYQTHIASRIRTEVKKEGKALLIGAVGLITEAEQAKNIVEEGGAVAARNADAEVAKEAQAAVGMTEGTSGTEPMADVILVARQFMREPEWTLRVAWQLGVDVAWPNQFLRVRFPKL